MVSRWGVRVRHRLVDRRRRKHSVDPREPRIAWWGGFVQVLTWARDSVVMGSEYLGSARVVQSSLAFHGTFKRSMAAAMVKLCLEALGFWRSSCLWIYLCAESFV
jgi:hypothetical protein